MVAKLSVLAGVLAGISSAVLASPVLNVRSVACTNEAGFNYEPSEKFISGLSGVTVFDRSHTDVAYFLIHCGKGQFVRVELTKEWQTVGKVRRSVVETIVGAERETFNDVANRFSNVGYVARVGSTRFDACLCTEDQ